MMWVPVVRDSSERRSMLGHLATALDAPSAVAGIAQRSFSGDATTLFEVGFYFVGFGHGRGDGLDEMADYYYGRDAEAVEARVRTRKRVRRAKRTARRKARR